VALTTHPHLEPRLKKVELYLYSPSGPSWSILGRTLPLPYQKLGSRFFVILSDVFLSFIKDVPCSTVISIFFTVDEELTHSWTERDKQGKVVLVHAVKMYVGSRYKALRILNLGNIWSQVDGFMFRPFYPRERAPVSIEYEAWWALEPVWTVKRR
jgi:hypothetical protein